MLFRSARDILLINTTWNMQWNLSHTGHRIISLSFICSITAHLCRGLEILRGREYPAQVSRPSHGWHVETNNHTHFMYVYTCLVYQPVSNLNVPCILNKPTSWKGNLVRVCAYTRVYIPYLSFQGAEFLHHTIQQWHHGVNHREAAQSLFQLRNNHRHVTRLPVDVLLSGPEAFVQSLVGDLQPQRHRTFASVCLTFRFSRGQHGGWRRCKNMTI